MLLPPGVLRMVASPEAALPLAETRWMFVRAGACVGAGEGAGARPRPSPRPPTNASTTVAAATVTHARRGGHAGEGRTILGRAADGAAGADGRRAGSRATAAITRD